CIQRDGALAASLKKKKIDVTALNSLKGRDIKAILRLYSLLKQFRPSVINVHDYSSLPYVVLSNWLSTRTPVIFTAHGLLYEGFENLRTRYRLFSWGVREITAVSEKVAERHRNYLNWKKQIKIIPNGVPYITNVPGIRAEIRKTLDTEDNAIVYLSVGNFRPEKGFEDLIKAASILYQQKPNKPWEIWIVGDLSRSSYSNQVIALSRSLGLENRIKFLGFRKDVLHLYQACNAFVLSSKSEGLPMVILEAMMAGLPIVATKVGGVPKALGEYGILVEPQNPVALARGMGNVLSNTRQAKQMGELARSRAQKKFSIKKMVDNYIKFYQSTISQL
ncbi:MAG TPA: glycosyltransferase, partial [Bacteroidetes bacterium]|nr:glycosyltransferase [Bacteroidota bacterium]